MKEDESISLDPFGVRGLADAIKIGMQAAIDFLNRICGPVADEFGLLLRDKVSYWRARNTVNIVQKAEKRLNAYPESEKKYAHPRLVASILERGSWVDNEQVQEMWAGLLASSCTEDGRDEGNLIFINILSQITSTQAIVLNHCCKEAEKKVSKAGWIDAKGFIITLEKLKELTGVSDLHRLDRELDHLRSLGIISAGFNPETTDADITPTALALQMYVQCQGFTGSPIEYFGLEQSDQEK